MTTSEIYHRKNAVTIHPTLAKYRASAQLLWHCSQIISFYNRILTSLGSLSSSEPPGASQSSPELPRASQSLPELPRASQSLSQSFPDPHSVGLVWFGLALALERARALEAPDYETSTRL